ncbi:uncharacterized protein GGS22DRAFT_167880 [Annulohypoxylon maeteangense]|uniref:uncharacterized protein n=1 Tax=Annulohypoxylon maeteangense TaxID=1927788 RepID=UPI0020079BCE|nr:uncharacterized protein GGS22DRAFT_167880 [Annulohypoxylon maeteangense]KAI0883102.1 hypothetical protein GGS22DRAFT_167880 [Annulohypoxylon maeteangense]
MHLQQYTTKAVVTSLLGASSLVFANPFKARADTGFSTGFRLIATVVGPTKHLTVPIQGAALEGAHVGAGLNTAVLNVTDPGRIFYLNGTAEDVRTGKTNIVTDGGTPLYPYGIGVSLNETDSNSPVVASINGGSGTVGVSLETDKTSPAPGILHFGTASFMACDESLPYYGPSRKFAVLKTFETSQHHTAVIPENCVEVNLHPLCAALPDLPAGSHTSHEFANKVSCFENLADIK